MLAPVRLHPGTWQCSLPGTQRLPLVSRICCGLGQALPPGADEHAGRGISPVSSWTLRNTRLR